MKFFKNRVKQNSFRTKKTVTSVDSASN